MDSKKILVGWSSIDVTPDKATTLVGQFNTRISEFVKDPVTATALALEAVGGGEQAIIVSLDAVWIKDDIRDACREKLSYLIPDFDPQKLLISVTHTHTAPSQASSFFTYPELDDPDIMKPAEYSKLLTAKLTEACVDAWKSRKPGAIAWGYGQAVVGFNRRITYFDGSAKMYGKTDDPKFSHLEGYEDQSVDMLFTYNDKRELSGMIVNIACPSQVTEGANFVSADFWHETREEIRKRHGKELFILPQCSAAGDLSPHLLLHKREQERMFKLKGFIDSANTDFNIAQRIEIAQRIANAVDEVLPLASTDIHESVPFAHTVSILQLPRRRITEVEAKFCSEQMRLHQDELAKYEQDPKSGTYSSNFVKAGYFGFAVKRYNEQASNPVLPMESHIIRLGDVAFASNRFELYLDFGIRIKARSKAIQTFVVQLAGEGSYLPTQRAIDAKSYGAGAPDNLVGPEGGQVLVEEQLRTINGLFNE
jgi:hypothetical protein